MAELIIVRHGNTFRKGETPTWVGSATDLPLVETALGHGVGQYLLAHHQLPDRVFAAPLQRTFQTAVLALDAMGISREIHPIADFSEFNHGPDENRTEAEVIQRLGRKRLEQSGRDPSTMSSEIIAQEGQRVLDAWNRDATVPPDWQVDIPAVIAAWKRFAAQIGESERVMLVTSNGMIRFAPHLLQIGYAEFCQNHTIKVATGGICVFDVVENQWVCREWNVRPTKLFPA